MRVERVIVRRARALLDRDDSFCASSGARDALCLRGLNGSGKTTYLELIAELWQWFRRCTQKRAFVVPETPLLADCELVAALFVGLPGPRSQMWVACGSDDGLAAFDRQSAGDASPYALRDGRRTWDGDVLAWWDEATASAELGNNGTSIPNIVFVGAENKWVPVLKVDELASPKPTSPFYPIARYLPSARGASHLEGMMRTLFLARREQWDRLAAAVRELRPGLELLDRFDEATQRPVFRLPSGALLTVDHLSAGERSLLVNLCMILRWLAPGGVVLLDEPELHQHVSLMVGSLSVIHDLVANTFGGQLLVASHAPEVWHYFRPSGAILDLDGAPR